MATKKTTTPKDFSNEDLNYLAGIFESNIQGIKGVSTVGALHIAMSSEWPEAMAALYGGTAEEFTSGKGKKIQGWFMGLDRRLELVKALEASDATKATTPYDFDKIRTRLEKALGS